MWSANPRLRGDVERTRQILQETARPFGGDLEGVVPLPPEAVDGELVEGTVAAMMGAAYESSCLAQTDLSIVPNNVAGYGVVDVYAAVQAALALQ
jgi:hypothetical protein